MKPAPGRDFKADLRSQSRRQRSVQALHTTVVNRLQVVFNAYKKSPTSSCILFTSAINTW